MTHKCALDTPVCSNHRELGPTIVGRNTLTGAAWVGKRGTLRFARVASVARGNPVRNRDCPAAVSGDERRTMHWLSSWEAAATRKTHESEDLPEAATSSGVACLHDVLEGRTTSR